MSQDLNSALETLPTEILTKIASFLPTLEDLVAFISVSRTTHSTCNALSSVDLIRITYQSRNIHFRPSPEYLLTYLSPSLALYSSESEEQRITLKQTFWHGTEYLLDFACHNSRIATISTWSFDTIRSALQDRTELWNPLEDLLDKCVGQQWYDIPNFWDGGRDDAYTLQAEPGKIGFQMAMWGGLFGSGYEDWLENAAATAEQRRKEDPNLERPDTTRWDPWYSPPIKSCAPAQRMDFLKYVIPDWLIGRTTVLGGNPPRHGCDYPPSPTDYNISRGIQTNTDIKHSLTAVQTQIGPYVQDGSNFEGIPASESSNCKVIYHLLQRSPLWYEINQEIRTFCGGDPFESQLLSQWYRMLPCLGIDGLRMIRQVWSDMEEGAAEREAQRQQDMSKPVDERSDGWWTNPPLELDRSKKYSGPGWDKLRRWKDLLVQLDTSPRSIDIVGCTSEFPDLAGDLDIVLRDPRGGM